jgi:hypothetical protein
MDQWRRLFRGMVAIAEAVVGMTSAAHATSYEAPAAASISAAKMPSFVMRAPCLDMDE